MKTFKFSPIALIDSGIGGLSLLKSLTIKYPNENYIYLADNLNMPYGNKSKRWLISRVSELINYLYHNFNVKLVILACNTASSCLTDINKTSPVKVLGLDLNKYVCDDCKILCTRLTCKNNSALNTYPCSNLAGFIEDNFFDKKSLNRYIKRTLSKANIDEQNIILGCTHYELISNIFYNILPDKSFILPCKEFVQDLQLKDLSSSTKQGDILMLSTLSTKSYIDKLWKIYKC